MPLSWWDKNIMVRSSAKSYIGLLIIIVNSKRWTGTERYNFCFDKFLYRKKKLYSWFVD